MCGILGGSCKNWDYEKGIFSLRHRGPDGLRIVKFEQLVLAFTRLSIKDLSENGMQPMFSEDEDVCIVFNGEIYGYRILKESLRKKGWRFKSDTDTEVILNAYMEYGNRFIDYIDGMFTIAIYDRRTHLVKLYRDRAGIKPLYYYLDGKNFAFASELKGLIELLQGERPQIDYTAIYDYLTYTYIPEPKTMYKNIYKLKPAHCLIFELNKKKIIENKKYWVLKVNGNKGGRRNQKDLEEEARCLINKSIKEQIIADVPVGSFLSGGVDSSIVTYECCTMQPQMETFSMGFTDKTYDETNYAKMLIERYSIKSNIGIMGKQEFKKMYQDMKLWYDEPFADTSAFSSFKVAELAKRKVTVVLTGDGGDEVFGGYSRYSDFKNQLKPNKFNSPVVSKTYETLKLGSEKLDAYFLEDIAIIAGLYGYPRKHMKELYRKKWGIPKEYDDLWYFRQHCHEDLPELTRMQVLDFNTYLPSDILTKVDLVTMQNSLEARVPLLSREIVEFSFGLTEEDRCKAGKLKGLLKSSYRNSIPKEILYRGKMGFRIPKSFMRTGKPKTEEILENIWGISL